MIPKENRFTHRQFAFFRKRMSAFRSNGFVFLYSQKKDIPKFSVVVSKKNEKKAVLRNAFRRKMYRSLFAYVSKFNIICLYKGAKIPQDITEIEKITKYLAQALAK